MYSGRVAEWPERLVGMLDSRDKNKRMFFGEYSMTVNTTSDYYGSFLSIKFLRFALK